MRAERWLIIVLLCLSGTFGPAKAVVGLFILMTASFLILATEPGAPGLVPVFSVDGALAATAVFALRGIYYALLEQGNVPLALTGTAVGMVSVIGYTPGSLAPLVSGLILDAWPGPQGFQVLYGLICLLSTLGLSASICIYRKVQAESREDEGVVDRIR